MQIKTEDFKKIMEYVKNRIIPLYVAAQPVDGSITGIAQQRMHILNNIPNLITLDQFLADTGEKKERTKREPNPDDRGFSKLWAAYPASPNFKYRGMTFKGDRALRSNYQVCETKYLKALAANPTLTPDMILRALEKQKKLAFEESYETGQNKLKYWNGLEVWLHQAKYEAFINFDDKEEEVFNETHEEMNVNDDNCA